MQKSLRKWSAKRSGAFITITGASEMGNPVKLAQVTSIEVDPEGPFAILDNGETYRLDSCLADGDGEE
jgi:hypothetical protein